MNESQNIPRSDEELFSTTVDLPSVDEQNLYLSANCVDDRQRNRIVQLLASHRELTSGHGPFVLDRTAEISESLDESLDTDFGKSIGPYRVIQLLGEGGMGLVYEAEQLEPIRRRVALKVLKPGMDTQKVLARFELERQALAGMDHPGITRILDAGMTTLGRPYFVMELVKGIAITDYCAEYQLYALDRIRLVIQVCKAIQHAHQKGIIHRDIKPSNVLVFQADGHPQPKIIDFGIAKLVNESLGMRRHDTYYGELIGTPAYMSPEQASSNLEGVDIRSDVYSLGVLLYELMTGETPNTNADATIGLVNVRRLLNESKIELPSIRLRQKSLLNSNPPSSLIPDLAATCRILKGDVDCIIMRALARNPNDRFQSITELQQDLIRFIEGKPIESVPPSILYHARKLVSRHRKLASLAVLASSLIFAASATAVWFGIVATDATQTAQKRLGEVLAMQSELLTERDRAVEAEKKTRILAQTFLAPALIQKAMDRFAREHWDALVEVNPKLGSLPPETRIETASEPELLMTLYDSNLLITPPRMVIHDDQRWLIKILSDVSKADGIDAFLQSILAGNSGMASEVSAEVPPEAVSDGTESSTFALTDSAAPPESGPVQSLADTPFPRFHFSTKAMKDYLLILCDELRKVSGGLPIAAEYEDHLGLCLLELGQPATALQRFEEAIRIRVESNPSSLQNFQSRLFIADCHHQLGNKALARSTSSCVQAELLNLDPSQDQSSIAKLRKLAKQLTDKSRIDTTTSTGPS